MDKIEKGYEVESIECSNGIPFLSNFFYPTIYQEQILSFPKKTLGHLYSWESCENNEMNPQMLNPQFLPQLRYKYIYNFDPLK